MATYTAGQVIARVLRLLGVLAEGEDPSVTESDDALMALNQMLDSWSTERLSVFTTTDQTFTWPSGEATQSLGPSGDFVGTRPVLLDDSTYYVVGGVSYPIQIVNEAQYNSIVVKGIESTLPRYLFIDQAFPDAGITLYPVPTQDVEFHFVSVSPLSEPANTGTVLEFPPGYTRAFTYNLALEIAPEFGVAPSNDVRRIAVASKRNIKRINDPGDVMSMPAPLIGRGYYNIHEG